MARTGRPRLENPRVKGIFIRLTEDEHTAIQTSAREHNLTITQTLVEGLETLREQGESRHKYALKPLSLIMGRW